MDRYTGGAAKTPRRTWDAESGVVGEGESGERGVICWGGQFTVPSSVETRPSQMVTRSKGRTFHTKNGTLCTVT